MTSFYERTDAALDSFDRAQLKMTQHLTTKPHWLRWREARIGLNMARREHLGLTVHGDLSDQSDLNFIAGLYAAHPDEQLLNMMVAWIAHVEAEKHCLPKDLMDTFDLVFFEQYEPTADTIWEWASKEYYVTDTPFSLCDEAAMENAHKLYIRHLFLSAVNHTLAKAGLPLV